MLRLLLVLLVLLGPMACTAEFSRADAGDCLLRFIDGLTSYKDVYKVLHVDMDETAKDGCVDVKEVEAAKQYYLVAWERALAWLVKSNEQIMRDCDNDKNGCISKQDMIDSVTHCLDGITRGTRRLDIFNDYICARGRKKELERAEHAALLRKYKLGI
jgi:hypothetical protein